MQHRLYGLRGKSYATAFKKIYAEEGDQIKSRFLEIKTNNGGKFLPKNLGQLCIEFQLPVTVMDRYLFHLGLFRSGVWDNLKSRGMQAKDIGVVWE